jgi:predicted nucleic acid-binding protein
LIVSHREGVLDTNIVAALALHDPDHLPDELLITAVTLGELSLGPHAAATPSERARRMAVLQHVEATFDVLPYDREAARHYGLVCAAVIVSGRQPRRRAADLMIAATAAANGLPLYTSNPKDFVGLDEVVEIVAVPRPDGA